MEGRAPEVRTASFTFKPRRGGEKHATFVLNMQLRVFRGNRRVFFWRRVDTAIFAFLLRYSYDDPHPRKGSASFSFKARPS